MEHPAHHHSSQPGLWALATSATLHCLLGCGLGDVVGVALGTAMGWSNPAMNLLSIVLGVLGGFGLGIRPWLKAGYSLGRAARRVLATEGISIGVMEAVMVGVQSSLPIVAHGHLGSPLFWVGMALALLAGFVVTWPVNYWLVRQGVRHH